MISEVASLQDYLDISGVIFVVLDPSGKITRINKMGCDLLRIEESEVLGTNWIDRFIPEENQDKVKEVFAELFNGSTKAVAQFENSVRTAEGEQKIISWQNMVLKDEQGTKVGVLSSGVDITHHTQIKKALLDTRRRYSELYNNVPIGIYRTTPDGQILLANSTLVKMLGYSSFEELKTRNLESGVYEASYSRQEFKNLLEEKGEVKGYEAVWVQHDGTNLYIRENVKVIRDETGEILYYEGTVEDITDLKNAMEASAYDRDLLQSLMDNLPDTIYFKDAECRFVRLNKAEMKILGVNNQEEAIGKTVADFSEPHYAQAVLRDEKNIISSGESIVSKIERICDATGDSRWMMTTKVPMRDQDSSVKGLIGISRDITKEKELTEELQQSEEKYRAVVENMLEGLCIIQNGVIQYANEALASILGYTVDTIIGREFMKFILPADRELVHERYNNRLQGEDTPTEYEFSIVNENNGLALIHIRSTLVSYHDQVATLVSIRDVTRQRQTEKLQSAVYRISEATHTSNTLDELYKNIHIILQELMPAKNMYIALYDQQTDLVHFPYYIDQYQKRPRPRSGGRGLTEYVLRQEEPFLASEQDFQNLSDGEEIVLDGYPSIDWLGVPLKYEEKVIGVLTIQNYDEDIHYGSVEKEIMSFVSEQVAMAISRKQTEEQLQKLSNVVSQTGDVVIITDTKGTVEYVNPAFEHLTGYSKNEACDRKADIILSPRRHNTGSIQRIFEVLFAGETYHTETLNRKKNGEPYYFELLVTPLKDYSGQVSHFILTGRDITERKQNELIQKAVFAISEATNKVDSLQALFTIIHDTVKDLMLAENFYIALWDQDTDLVSYPYFVDINDEPPAPRKAGKGVTEHVLRTGEPLLTSEQGLRELAREGKVELAGSLPTDWLGIPLKKDKQTIGVLAVQNYSGQTHYTPHDKDILSFVSEQVAMAINRKQTQSALAAERERLAVTLRSIGDGVISTDIEGRVLLMNKMAEQLTGWTLAEAMNRPLAEIFPLKHASTGESFAPDIQDVMQVNAVCTLPREVKLIDRSGNEKYIADSIAPLRDEESRVIGTVLVFRDITEQRNLETEALKARKLESIGVLAGGIAHDFNNILSGILGNISLARLNFEDLEKAANLLGQAENASKRAAKLTKQLLTFSKGGAPVKEEVSMEELVRESVTFALRGSNVRCKLLLEEGLWKAEVDPGQIDQVLQNLIINADQAMPEGGTILIRGENRLLDQMHHRSGLKPGRYVKIEIEDHGTGISAENLDRIFDPYFTTKQSGHGLGLSTCYAIIQKHGGRISVKSQKSKGTTMTILLPASAEEPTSMNLEGGGSPGGAKFSETRQGRVLVMDDDQTVQLVAEQMLSQLGFHVEIVPDGEAALQAYQQAKETGAPFDAVILDLTIPGGMGGKRAIQKLRNFDSQVRGIVSSGYSTDPILSAYREYGFKGKISKPYDITELHRVLDAVLAS